MGLIMPLKSGSQWLLSLLLVLGCFAVGSAQGAESQEAALKSRAQQFWEAVLINDWATEYRMEADTLPGKNLLRPDQFAVIKSNRLTRYSYETARIEDIKIDGENGVVIVITDQRVTGWDNVRKGIKIEDHCVFINDQWYHQSKDSTKSMDQALRNLRKHRQTDSPSADEGPKDQKIKAAGERQPQDADRAIGSSQDPDDKD